jgi:hypothetical protein
VRLLASWAWRRSATPPAPSFPAAGSSGCRSLALIGAPRVAILDELTIGLDPQARRETWQLISRVRKRGVTIGLRVEQAGLEDAFITLTGEPA